MNLLREVGAVAGLASFLGLALLALLYFAQARDVRRLSENASFLVEGGADGSTTAQAEKAATVAPTAATVATKDPEKAAAAAAATAPSDAEAFRRAELARQAAERRQRFEQRRRGPRRPSMPGGRELPGWLSEPRSVAVVAVGALLLVGGVVFGATRIVGGSSSSTSGGAKASHSPCPPSQTNIAVLNGTATAGLAAQFAAPLKQKGYKTSPVGNTESPVATSVVMFDPQTGPQCAPIVSGIVGIQKTQPMSNEIRGIAGGNPVAVVLGDDEAGGSSSGISSGTTSTGI
jgi:hypothetical protein